MISQTYDLNLIPSQIPVTIHCSQYDDGSRTFVFNLYEGASAFELPVGASATFSGVKPDGLGFQYACSITGSSQVSVDVALQMTAVAGDCPCKVTVYDTDSNVLGSALCVLDVERHPLQDDTVISDSDIPLVQEAVNWAAQFQPSDFVVKNQGIAQAGKVLGIGADGMVTPTTTTMDAENVSYNGILPQSDNVEEAIDNVYVRTIDSYMMTNPMETTMADEDRIPFRDENEGAAKNITLPNFVDTISPNFYRVTDSAETTIDDADSIPFYDTSASAKKRITWSNIVTKIKSSLANYFGRKFSQSNGKLSLLAENNTILDTVTLSPLATNTTYTDTNNIGATNVQSAVDKMFSIFSGKFYERDIYNYSTSGTWADYTKNTIQFSLPSEAIGTGKTFMLVHNFRAQQAVDGNIESFIDTPNNSATFFSSARFYGRMLSQGWCSYTQIVFLTSNVNPTIRINVATSAPVKNNIISWCTLVPLN